MDKYSFPENLRRIRKERGLSQEDLAQKVGVAQECISQYERSVKYPAIDRVYDIARALDVEPTDLISMQ